MDHFLGSWCFNKQEEMVALVKEFFALKEKNWYQYGIRELTEKWVQMASPLNTWLLLS